MTSIDNSSDPWAKPQILFETLMSSLDALGGPIEYALPQYGEGEH